MMEYAIARAMPGQTVYTFAAEIVAQAWEQNCVVLGEFNQHTLEARPGSTTDEVLRPWNEYQRDSYSKR